MYGVRAPRGELCNKVCMYVCMYVRTLPVCPVWSSGMNVVAEAKTINQAGLPSFRPALDYLEGYGLNFCDDFARGRVFD